MDYNLIVIGAGAAGLNIAMFMNKAGFNVLLIDKDKESIGGDCLNNGCVPSKALINVSEKIYHARQAEEFGFNIEGSTDMEKVKSYIQDKQEIIREHENVEYFRKQGIDIKLGTAKFLDEKTVKVNNEEYTSDKIVIATGSKPRELNIPGSENVNIHTNETIFNLSKTPNKLLIIGGGPIGIELGQAFNRLGSNVTILERNNRILGKEPKKASKILTNQLREEGINIQTNSKIKEFTNENTALIKNKNNEETEIIFDEVLASIGRKPNTKKLQLEKANIKTTENNGVKVNKKLQTNNSRVYATGDVIDSLKFTHATEHHASIILNNFFSPFKKKINMEKIPWVTYTNPEIATFGKTKKQLRKENQKHQTRTIKMNETDRGIIENDPGELILYTQKDKILGGTLIGNNAGEIIQELILAKQEKIGLKNLFKKIYPYPTRSRINKKAAEEYYSQKLTSFVKKIMHWLY